MVSFPCPWEEALTGGPDNLVSVALTGTGPPRPQDGEAPGGAGWTAYAKNSPLPARRRGLLFAKGGILCGDPCGRAGDHRPGHGLCAGAERAAAPVRP